MLLSITSTTLCLYAPFFKNQTMTACIDEFTKRTETLHRHTHLLCVYGEVARRRARAPATALKYMLNKSGCWLGS